MVHVFNFARQYAEETGGQFTDYDHSKAILVVPLSGGRFQTLLVITRTSPYSGKELAIFSSKVCELDSSINLRELLEENLNFDYCKFIIEDNFVKVEASCVSTSANDDQIKEMIMEVATVADQMELKFTGLDVH